jgi:hypothetical protein
MCPGTTITPLKLMAWTTTNGCLAMVKAVLVQILDHIQRGIAGCCGCAVACRMSCMLLHGVAARMSQLHVVAWCCGCMSPSHVAVACCCMVLHVAGCMFVACCCMVLHVRCMLLHGVACSLHVVAWCMVLHVAVACRRRMSQSHVAVAISAIFRTVFPSGCGLYFRVVISAGCISDCIPAGNVNVKKETVYSFHSNLAYNNYCFSPGRN